MTVKQLIEKLESCDLDDPVLLSTDPEGNSFGMLHSVEPGTCDSLIGRIECGIRELTHSLAKDGFDEQDVKDIPCVALWPGY